MKLVLAFGCWFLEITIDAYDADLTWILDRFSPGRPAVLVAQSWGGMYATRYIAHHPEKIAGAVLMESGPMTGELFSEIASEYQTLDFFSEWLNDLAWAEHISRATHFDGRSHAVGSAYAF
jgi:pimeloyl-ACP methyl ester carboxylesterase